MENSEDYKLIDLIKNGHEEAFADLAPKYLSLIHSKAIAYKAESVDFEDFVQEGLLALLVAAKSYTPDKNASFNTYAGVCISNRFASIVRKNNRKKDVPHNMLISYEQDDFSLHNPTTPEQEIIDKENYQNVMQKIKKSLSPLEYDVLKYYLIGKSYEQIASILKLPEKSVDNALQRIRKKFKNN